MQTNSGYEFREEAIPFVIYNNELRSKLSQIRFPSAFT